MTDLARGAGAFPPVQAPTPALGFAVASARRSFGIVRPSMPSPPTLSMWRREKRAEVWKLSQAEVRRFMASIPARLRELFVGSASADRLLHGGRKKNNRSAEADPTRRLPSHHFLSTNSFAFS